MPGPETRDDLTLLVDAVGRAGRIALDHFGMDLERRDKVDGTPVTDADLAVDRFLATVLRAARPGYGWLSEETVDDESRLGAERVWVVDPIDGTESFLKGSDEWMVSVALVEHGAPILAALCNPLRGEFYEADRGGGARMNGKPIATSTRSEIAGCRMLANVAAFRPERWHAPWPEMDRRGCRSMAYRLCQVADGRFDATLAVSGKHDWDLAAAHLVVEEAGGRLTALDGAAISYNGVTTRHATTVAAGDVLHRALLARAGDYAGRAA